MYYTKTHAEITELDKKSANLKLELQLKLDEIRKFHLKIIKEDVRNYIILQTAPNHLSCKTALVITTETSSSVLFLSRYGKVDLIETITLPVKAGNETVMTIFVVGAAASQTFIWEDEWFTHRVLYDNREFAHVIKETDFFWKEHLKDFITF